MTSVANVYQIRGIKTRWMAARRRRWPRPVSRKKRRTRESLGPGERQRKKTKKRAEGTHSGGHQRQWSMVGLPVAVFLHNRFSGLHLSFSFFLFSSSSHSGYHPPRSFGDLLSSGLAGLAPAGLDARSSFGFFPALPISPYVGNVHTPAYAVQLAGGCILITFMSSDIPARFIAPAPADSAKTWNQPHPTSFSPSPTILLACPLSYASLVLRFLRFSLLQDHPSSLGPRNQPCMVAVLPSL